MPTDIYFGRKKKSTRLKDKKKICTTNFSNPALPFKNQALRPQLNVRARYVLYCSELKPKPGTVQSMVRAASQHI